MIRTSGRSLSSQKPERNHQASVPGQPQGAAGKSQFFPNTDLALGVRCFWKHDVPNRMLDISQENRPSSETGSRETYASAPGQAACWQGGRQTARHGCALKERPVGQSPGPALPPGVPVAPQSLC